MCESARHGNIHTILLGLQVGIQLLLLRRWIFSRLNSCESIGVVWGLVCSTVHGERLLHTLTHHQSIRQELSAILRHALEVDFGFAFSFLFEVFN